MTTQCPPLHSPWQATGAALLGGPSAGLWLIADNFKAIGWEQKARNLRIGLVVVFIATIAFAIYGPELKSYTLLGVLHAAVVRQYAVMSYGKTYERHLSEGGKRQGHQAWVIAGLVGIAVSLVALFGYFFGVGALAPQLLPERYFE